MLQYFTKGFQVEEEDENGPKHSAKRKRIEKVGSFFKNIFSKKPKLSTRSYMNFDKG